LLLPHQFRQAVACLGERKQGRGGGSVPVHTGVGALLCVVHLLAYLLGWPAITHKQWQQQRNGRMHTWWTGLLTARACVLRRMARHICGTAG
jgi:hypothetical protein